MFKKGFTLLEILIVVALLVILGIMLILLIDPLAQIGKSKDTRRKHDLDVIKKAIEEYYNDKGCYPKPPELCYDGANPINVCIAAGGSYASRKFVSQICHICGSESGSPNFSPYLSNLPCDPDHPGKKYIYEVESTPNISCGSPAGTDITANCASWFRIYSQLSRKIDIDMNNLGCQGGACGLTPNTLPQPGLSPYPYGFDYGVASTNRSLNRSSTYYCFTDPPDSACNSCGSDYDICNGPTKNCQTVYASFEACKAEHP